MTSAKKENFPAQQKDSTNAFRNPVFQEKLAHMQAVNWEDVPAKDKFTTPQENVIFESGSNLSKHREIKVVGRSFAPEPKILPPGLTRIAKYSTSRLSS